MPPKAQVLLADCCMRGGLAVVRSLGRAGVSSVVVAGDKDDLVFRSRYAKEQVLSPSPESDPEGFMEEVRRTAEAYDVGLVLPVTDRGMQLLDEHRDTFPDGITLALSSSAAIRNVLDKSLNLEMAERIGVPCPKRFTLEHAQQVPEMVKALGLPVVMKNPFPEKLPGDGGLPFRFLVVKTEEELQALVETHSACSVTPLFQEYGSGQTENFCCFAVEGETMAMHQYVSLRRGSHAGVFREIIPLKEDLAAHVRNILRELCWSGVAHIQFVTNKESGKSWYMETNGRIWASTQGSMNAGWNFPFWFYDYFMNGNRPQVPPLHVGSQTVYRRGDLELLINYLRGYQSPTFYTDPGKMWAIRKYLATANPRIKSDVWSWTDPMPGLSDFGDLGRTLLAGLKGRVERRGRL